MLAYHIHIVSSALCMRACMYWARVCIYGSTICVCACACVCECETFQPGGYYTDLPLARF